MVLVEWRPGSVHYSVACPVLIWFKKIPDDSPVLVSVGAQMNVSHAVSRVYFTLFVVCTGEAMLICSMHS